MKTTLVCAIVTSLLWVNPLFSQDYSLFGSACTITSQHACDLLSFAIRLTDPDNPQQFGVVRLPDAFDLEKGMDGRLCLQFSQQEDDEKCMTFYFQLDTLVADPLDNCNVTPRPVYPYDDLIKTFFAIRFRAIKDDASLGKSDEIELLKKQNNQLTTLATFKAPFNLDQPDSIPIPIRILYLTEKKRLQLYISGNLVFDICIDLINDVFTGQSQVYLAMSGQTEALANPLVVSVAVEDYDLCAIGNCKISDSDFKNWLQSGPGEQAEWKIDTNYVCTQLRNDNLSFFLNPCVNWINVRIRFKVKVNDPVLNGAFGCVWGWGDYTCSSPDRYKGQLFGWRHQDGVLNGYQAGQGKIFAAVDGVIADHSGPGGLLDHFWANHTGPSWKALASPLQSAGDAWLEGVQYDVRLEYTVLGTKIWVDNILILDAAAPSGQPNEPGQFGLFTYEQAGVSFWGVMYEYLDEIVVPSDTLCANTNTQIQVINLTQGYDDTHITGFTWDFEGQIVNGLKSENSIYHTFTQPGPSILKLAIHTTFNNCDLIILDNLFINPFDPPHLPNDTLLCHEEVLYLDVFNPDDPNAFYTWPNGSSFHTYVGSVPELIWVQKTSADSVCVARDSLVLDYSPAVEIMYSVTSACELQDNGFLSGTTAGGSPPFLFNFLGQQSDQLFFENLSGLVDALVVTDSLGCIFKEEVSVPLSPRPEIELEVRPISCYRAGDGRVIVSKAPDDVEFSADGLFFSTLKHFDGIDTGLHVLYYRTPDECTYDIEYYLPEPPILNVDIHAPTLALSSGITVPVGVDIIPGGFTGTIFWKGQNVQCDTCFATYITPIENGPLLVTITDTSGCNASDTVLIRVNNADQPVFVANVFKPGDYGPNSRVWVNAAPVVERINCWRIYDRWGNLVFSKNDFLPNDPANGWDGFLNGKPLQPGVYTFLMQYTLHSGERRQLSGDTAIVR